MTSALSSAGIDRAHTPLFGDTLEVSPRLKLRRKNNPAPALAVFGLGSAMAFGAAEAAAKTKTIMQNGESFFNVGDLTAQQLPSGAMEITFANGQKIVIPAGEYGYSRGDLFISEKHMPQELAHAVMTPEQIDGYVFSKTATAEGLSPVATAAPDTYTVVRPTYLTQLTAAGVIVLAGAAAWYILTKIGDAPEFEYPIYTATFEENGTGTVYTAMAKDLDSPALIYSLRDDNDEYDNEFFEIDSSSGDLTFITPPNHEAPADDNENNVYDVKIDATDSDGGIGSMLLHITVSDQATEDNAETLTSGGALNVAGTNNPEDVEITSGSYTGGTIALGAGQDYLLIGGSARFTAAATIAMGTDDDLVVIDHSGTNTGSTPSIDLGGGDDIVELNSDQAGNYAISLGTGSDTLRIGTDSLAADPSISLFTSDDTLDLRALNLSTIDTTAYSSTALAEAAIAGATAPDIAYFTAGSDTTVLIDSDGAGNPDITLVFKGVTTFDTDTILL